MVSDVYHFYDIVHFHLTPPFHLLLLFFSRSPAQTWVEIERPSPAPEGTRKAPGSRDCQAAGQPSSISAQLPSALPRATLHKPQEGKGKQAAEAVWVQLPKAAISHLAHQPHTSTNSVLWASGLHLRLPNEDKGTCSAD